MTKATLAFLAVAAALFAAPSAQAQFVVPPRGQQATFDMATWNLEFFGEPSQGPSDAGQFARVLSVIRQADIDLWAFQEVSDGTDFYRLIDSLATDGYVGVLGPSVSSPQNSAFDQKLGFIYNPAVVGLVGVRTVISGTSFGGRSPLMMTARVTLGRGEFELRIIDIHAKALGDLDSYNKRVAGSAQLKTYTDDLLSQGLSVIVLGDYNDELLTSTASGRPSPYLNFANDTAYAFASQRLNDQNIPTFCSNASCTSGSTLDHILLAGDVRTEYVADSGDRYGELIAAIPGYRDNTTDHLPVLARFQLAGVADEAGPEARTVTLLPAAPSPFRTATTLRFELETASDVQITVVDLLGRTVARLGGAYGPGAHRLTLDGSDLAAGLYRVRLVAGGEVQTQTIVRAR